VLQTFKLNEELKKVSISTKRRTIFKRIWFSFSNVIRRS